jgi:membrane AbrB-like protein
MPGGLQDMLVFGIEAGGNARALSLVHATRVLVIVSIMPVLLTWGWGLTLDHAPGSPARDIPLVELAVMLACAILGWRVGKRIGLFGAAILGPLVLSAAASLTGLINHRPPAEAILVAQFFIGLGVGVKYTGVTIGELQRIVAAALGYCVILAILSVAFAELAHFYAGTPQVEALLAFAPGGQGEMVVLAFVSGADLACVVTHHLVRLIVVILGAPIAARWLR